MRRQGIVLLTILGGLVFAVALAVIAPSLPHSHKLVAQMVVQPANSGAISACPEDDTPIPDPATPASILSWMVQASGNQPRWIHWCTKADVGLEKAPTGEDLKKLLGETLAFWQTKVNARADFRALQSLPLVQLRIPAETSSTLRQLFPSPEKPSIAEELNLSAPVLFNPTAAKAISSAIKSNKLLSGTFVMPPNSVIVKTIWVLQTSDNSVFNQPLAASQEMPIEEGRPPSKLPDPRIPPNPFISISISNSATDGETSTCIRNKTGDPFPQECLAILSLPKSEASLRRQFHGVGGTSCMNSECRAILVGFHVMLKTQNHPLWQFMTFWLTPQQLTNHGDLLSPWNLFVSNGTEQRSSDSRKPHSVRASASATTGLDICFNPYLEGDLPNGNGTVSNCAGCHQYARYYKAGSADSEQHLFDLAQTVLGAPPLPAASTAATPVDQVEGCALQYLASPALASADFVWSIETYKRLQGDKRNVNEVASNAQVDICPQRPSQPK